MEEDDDIMEDGGSGKKGKGVKEKEKPKPIFIQFKGDAFAFYLKGIKKWNKNEYFNGTQTVYSIDIYEFDGSETNIEYLDERIRNVEYVNLLDKLKEYGVILV